MANIGAHVRPLTLMWRIGHISPSLCLLFLIDGPRTLLESSSPPLLDIQEFSSSDMPIKTPLVRANTLRSWANHWPLISSILPQQPPSMRVPAAPRWSKFVADPGFTVLNENSSTCTLIDSPKLSPACSVQCLYRRRGRGRPCLFACFMCRIPPQFIFSFSAVYLLLMLAIQ